MSLSEQVRNSNSWCNLDIVVEVGADLSAYASLGVRIDQGRVIRADSSGLPRLIGVLQNSPVNGYAVARYMGLTSIVYGATVAVGDLLLLSNDPASLGKAFPFAQGTDGHTHTAGAAVPIKFVAEVRDPLGNPLTGLVLNTSVTMTVQELGASLAAGSGAKTLTGINGVGAGVAGEYLVSYTPSAPDKLCRIRLSGVAATAGDGAVFSPSVHHETSHGSPGPPTYGSLRWIMGMAMTDGNAGDTGLMLMRPQTF